MMDGQMSNKDILRTVCGLMLLSVALCPNAFSAQELSVEQVVQRALPAVVRIVCFDKAGDPKSQGTGFFITPRNILTNAHVVDDAYSLSILPNPNENDSYYQPRILKIDPEVDLALIEVDEINQAFLLLESEKEGRPGQPVVTVGNWHSGSFLASEGIIRARSAIGIMISALIHHGHSGSPLLNMRGCVVGVLYQIDQVEETDALIYAVELTRINRFLSKPNKPFILQPAGTKLFWPHLAKRVYAPVLKTGRSIFNAGWWSFTIFVKLAGLLVFCILILQAISMSRGLAKKYCVDKDSKAVLIIIILVGVASLANLSDGEKGDSEVIILIALVTLLLGILFFISNRSYHLRKINKKTSSVFGRVQSYLIRAVSVTAFFIVVPLGIVGIALPFISGEKKAPVVPYLIYLMVLCFIPMLIKSQRLRNLVRGFRFNRVA